MNTSQRNEANNQSDNGDNEKSVSSSRAGSTADKDNLNQSQQSGTLHGDAKPQGSRQGGAPDDRASGAVGGGEPMAPAGNRQSADKKMDDDTGLSNTANRQPEPDRQDLQSNVGRRSDGTPD
jgi:hypothetical protein